MIDIKEEDTLYVLGDVIDRGPYGMKILQDMMMRPNVIPILGNHEYMASISIPWLLNEVTEESVENIDEDTLQEFSLYEYVEVGLYLFGYDGKILCLEKNRGQYENSYTR
ncbi:MAG: metallophosphoesterase [Eubacterium sp.]|nr:metallophosphoesterase [Eubacterium sp.]